jgi:O-antigen/teichoic acid export membrane protein
VLTALFGILILESISSQVIQSATAKLTAQYKALGEEAALHVFVRRWSTRIVGVLAGLAVLVVALAGPIAGGLSLPALAVVLLGISLFFAGTLTFALGLLQGLARFGWMGSVLIVQAGTRLAAGVLLVYAGTGVTGAFAGATTAVGVSLVAAIVPLAPLLSAARGAVHAVELGAAETRFFVLAAVVLLAYAALTNVDAVLARTLLSPDDAGAYAGAVTLGKIVLFAPIAIGYLLLERTARAQARGEDTERALGLALAFVLVTSGAVALAYLIAPALVVGIVVGAQYPATAALVGPYGIAALANALLSLWIAYFVGRGEMRIGILLAVAVVAEVFLLATAVTDAASMVRVVLVVALATQAAAIATFALGLRRRRIATAAG